MLTAALFFALLWPGPVFQTEDPSRETQRLNQEALQALEGGQYDEAIAKFKRIVELNPEDSTAPYNLACAYAKQGQTESALEWLAKAVAAGYEDYYWAHQDPDLASIRQDPKFEEILAPVAPKPAPELVVRDLNGQELTLSGLRGKVVFVDFWGTWCPPCRKSIPHLVELYRRYRDRGFLVVGLAYERGTPDEAKTKLRAFMAEHGIDYPVALGDAAQQQAFGGIEGYPTIFAITADGKIYAKVLGYHEADFLDNMAQKLLEMRDAAPAADNGAEALERGRTMAADARAATRWRGAEALAQSGRGEALESLIGLLGDPVPWIREGVIDMLRKLTGQDLGYHHDASEADRAEAQARWRAWYTENHDRLVYDPASKQFVVVR